MLSGLQHVPVTQALSLGSHIPGAAQSQSFGGSSEWTSCVWCPLTRFPRGSGTLIPLDRNGDSLANVMVVTCS